MDLHIDADGIVYRAGFAAESVEKKEGGLIEVRPEPLPNCLQIVKTILRGIVDDNEHDEVYYYLSGKTNFRDEIVSDYKANRKGTRKPYWYAEIREYITDNYNAIIMEGIEADDAISIACAKDPANNIAVTQDKDFNTFEGWKYNWVKKGDKVWWSKEDALKFFYTQVLTGDQVDNIQGLPHCSKKTIEKYGLHHSAKKGCGEKSAALILASCTTEQQLFSACLGAYEAYALEAECEEAALSSLTTQGQLLHMVRELDEHGQPVMWQPPVEANPEEKTDEEAMVGEREAVA